MRLSLGFQTGKGSDAKPCCREQLKDKTATPSAIV
jgi:hypothetical protein